MKITMTTVKAALAITAGLILCAAALGEFALRIAIALAGLWLINYGMRLLGMPTLQTYLMLLVNMLRFRI